MSNKKIYAVKKGNKTGLFYSWDECKKSIEGFSGSIYKSFTDKKEAEEYLNQKNENDKKEIDSNFDATKSVNSDLDEGLLVIFVDGSFSKQTNSYGFGVVALKKENNTVKNYEFFESFKNEKYLPFKNVSGEIFGVIKSIEWAISMNEKNIKIYYDYEGIEKWITNEWKAKTEISKLYIELFNKNKDFFEYIGFQKVSSHSSILYNEIADNLAKKSLTGEKLIAKFNQNFFILEPFNVFEKFLENLKKEFINSKEICLKNISNNNNETKFELSCLNEKIVISFYKTKNKLMIQGKISNLFSTVIVNLSEHIS